MSSEKYIPPHRRRAPATTVSPSQSVEGKGSAWTFQRRDSPYRGGSSWRGRGDARPRNSTGSDERCVVCNDSNSRHNLIGCPVGDSALARLTPVTLYRGSGNESDCFADWHDEPCLDRKAHIKVYYKSHSQSYVFIGDDKNKWAGVTEFRPSKSSKYLEVPVSDLPAEGIAALLVDTKQRISRSMIYGNSLREVCSTGRNEGQIERLAGFLAEETVLMRAVKLRSSSLRDHPGSVKIRMTKGLVDSHDMDTATAVIMGYVDSLDELVNNYRPDTSVNDAATALVHVDTSQFMECNDVLGLVDVKETLEALEVPVERPRTAKHHLECAKNAMNHINSTLGVKFPPRLLLTVCNYTDQCYIDIPGGMRELGETPLECAIKEAREEAGVILTDANLSVKGEQSGLGAGAQWEVYLHDQNRVNQYFIRRDAIYRAVTEVTTGIGVTSVSSS